MSSSIKITLRGGERLFVNGAVLKADRRVSLELLNGATFLLEHHVMAPEKATTPLAQLYLLIQSALVEPAHSAETRRSAMEFLARLTATSKETAVRDGLTEIRDLLGRERLLEAMKKIRSMLPVEIPVAGSEHVQSSRRARKGVA
jgi:flagellar biosynthesis repressor protein FlbT